MSTEEIRQIRALGHGNSAKAILVAAAVSATIFPSGAVNVYLFTANLVDALDAAQSTAA